MPNTQAQTKRGPQRLTKSLAPDQVKKSVSRFEFLTAQLEEARNRVNFLEGALAEAELYANTLNCDEETYDAYADENAYRSAISQAVKHGGVSSYAPNLYITTRGKGQWQPGQKFRKPS